MLECCRLDPANLLYRQALRRAQKAGLGNRRRAGWLARLRTWPLRARLRVARRAGRYVEMLHLGERILARDPYDAVVQVVMAGAAEALSLPELAVWCLEQARQADPDDPDVNRRLARLYERRGHFTQARELWALVRKAAPDDEEAAHKEEVPEPKPADDRTDELRLRLQADPTDASSYRELARLLRAAGQWEPAKVLLRNGLAATGNAFELAIELADIQVEPFRLDLAATEAKLAAQPSDELHRVRDDLQREVNGREFDLFRLLADRYPARADYRYEAGLRLLRGGRADEAVEVFASCQTDPALAGLAQLAQGRAYRELGDVRRARGCFEAALEALPPEAGCDRVEALYELARCHADLGELPRAVDLAGRLDPTHRDVAHLIEDWQIARPQRGLGLLSSWTESLNSEALVNSRLRSILRRICCRA